MKWIVFIAALGLVVPLAVWLRGNPALAPRLYMLLGILPFWISATPELDIALVSWRTWFGHTHGIEVTSIDFLALAILISQPRARYSIPFRIVFAMYFVAIVVSVFQARVPLAAGFYVWQLVRMYVIYEVVARACADERAVIALLKGLAIGLIAEAVIVIWQRYGIGIVQTQGTFAHQNTLGMIAHLIVMPWLALLLSGPRSWQPITVVLAGAVIAVLTASRAAVAFTLLGVGFVYLGSICRDFTRRKFSYGMVAAAIALVMTPLAISSFQQRFAVVPLDLQYDEREAFKRAAAMIVADHPMGVGANHYVAVSKNDGYSERAGVLRTSRNSHVHNVYWLTAVEAGYLGLLFFLLLLLVPMVTGFWVAWSNRRDQRGDLLLGLSVGLLMVYVHSWYEWILLSAQVQYLVVLAFGMVAGLAHQLRRAPESTMLPKRWAQRPEKVSRRRLVPSWRAPARRRAEP